MRRKVLLTGANGFLGEHFKNVFETASDLTTLGRSENHSYPIDLASKAPSFKESFDLVLHNAGKAHIVPQTESEREAFLKVNFSGTQHLLEGLTKCPSLPKQIVFISTIAVYGKEAGKLISEDHPLTGQSPYAKSKILAERAVAEWCLEHGVKYVILRLPLVAGINPPGNLKSISKAIRKGYYFSIAGNEARKSVVLAEDVARLIPQLAERQGIYNLTDGVHPSFTEIERAIAKSLNKNIIFALPFSVAAAMAKAGDGLNRLKLPAPLTTAKLSKITSTLTFDDKKARRELNWNPRPVIAWIEKHFS